MKRGIRAKIAAAGVLAVLGFFGYEAFAVARANARTPSILGKVAHRPIALQSLPERRLAMLLAVEDPGFFRHRGVDFSSPGQGATTLTQALVKRLYFESFKPGFAKIEQSLIARFVLDPALSKRDQLEVFLNHASFGNHLGRQITGFDDGARTYLGKELASLDDREFLVLVAMLMGPNALDPLGHPAANAERVGRIEAMLAGKCRPADVRDVTYKNCANRSAPPAK